jgi:hypothetical protein
MSQEKVTQELLEADGIFSDEIENDDYCFIFDGDGNLKGAILPEVLPFKSPKNIAKILKLLGIADISMIDQEQPLH